MDEIKAVPEDAKSEEAKQEDKRVIGWQQDGMFLVCTVPLADPYKALGISFDFLCDIRDRLSFARMAEERKRQELLGGDSLKNGMQKNVGFWKKYMSK